MIQLYGVRPSRTARVIWMLEETGLEYELKEMSPYGEEINQEPYRSLNPNGHVPTLVDGETVLWESMAINLYLAHKYGGELQPATPDEWGQAYKWGFWGMTEAEALLLQVLNHRRSLPKEKREPALADEAEQKLQKPLGVLNGALEGKETLLGTRFTVADLNLAAIFSWGKFAKINLSAFPNLDQWLNRCLERPAHQKLYS